MANDNLTSAKRAKNDEFYTQYDDIETEIAATGSDMQGGRRFYLDIGNGAYERLYERIVIRKRQS